MGWDVPLKCVHHPIVQLLAISGMETESLENEMILWTICDKDLNCPIEISENSPTGSFYRHVLFVGQSLFHSAFKVSLCYIRMEIIFEIR